MMESVIFKTYDKQKIKYYLINGTFILFLVGSPIVILTLRNAIYIFGIFFLIGFVWLILSITIIPGLKCYKSFIENGEIEFNENYITILNKKYYLKEIRKIRIDNFDCKGQIFINSMSDGGANYIEVFFHENTKLKVKYVIENKKDLKKIFFIVKEWKKTDIQIISERFKICEYKIKMKII